MAETKSKKRAAPKRARSSQKRKSAKPKSRAKAKPRAKAKARPKAKAATSRSGTTPAEAARQTVEHKAKDARGAVGDAADKAGDIAGKAGSKAGEVAGKAKIPLLAGGAALAGAAGGLALASRAGHRHRGIVRAIRKPRIRLDSDDVARAARGVGKVSAQVAELATGVQRASESTNGDGHHNRRSPIEVVLQGLTTRR